MNYCHNKERFGDLLTLKILQTICDEQLTEKDLEWSLQNCRVYSWPQLWPNTACGFSGIAGQAFTTAQTTVFEFICGNTTSAIIFHGDRHAYSILNTNEMFRKAFIAQQLMGAQDYVGQYETDK